MRKSRKEIIIRLSRDEEEMDNKDKRRRLEKQKIEETRKNRKRWWKKFEKIMCSQVAKSC